MKRLTSLDELNLIVKNVFRKGCLTNNFILLDAYGAFINENKLWVISDENNAAFLLDKEDFFQVFYYLNNLNKAFELSVDKPVVMEILYRGLENKPQNIIDYWVKQGFNEHLSRDNMISSWIRVAIPDTLYESMQIRYATSEKELLFTKELFDKALDKYTGDQLTEAELRSFMTQKNLLCAYFREELAGVLQFEIKNTVVWLGHIAIHPDFRGKGIANALLNSYITLNRADENTRYALWVIPDNLPAVNLYRKFGFFYGNKSTVSLLKNA
jgi:ribosomal protein S18 acetylase RimI-like enzyme